MIDAPSFSQPYLCIKLPLKSPRKIQSSTLINFYLLIPAYLFTKSFLQPPLHFLPPYLINFLPLYFWVQPSQQSAPKAFSLPQPFSQFRLPQGNTMKSPKDWHWFNLSLLPQSMPVITGLTTTNYFSLRLIKLVMTGNEDDEDLWWRWLQSE